jgi:hypothetical protein
MAILCLVAALPACGRNAPGPDAADIAANNRGVGLMGMYKYDDADDVFRALAREHPDWVDVNVNLAIATFNRQQEGDEAIAMEILLAALETEPDNLRARYCTGLLMYRSALAGAIDHLEFVARSDPADPYAAYFYGSALEQADRADEALAEYRRALDLDPYLRSAIYRISRILLRSGRTDEGMTLQETFQKLADNPRARTIDFVYTKMGPKAEALAVGLSVPVSPQPSGPLFADAVPLLPAGPTDGWTQFAGVTACDLNGDGQTDLFLAGALQTGNAVVLAGSDGFTLDTAHPLAGVTSVNTVLWGDYDNDGLTDVYFCRQGANQLWRQVEQGRWSDVTGSTGTANGEHDTVDGAFFDADHDGDLDLFCVNADGPNELLNNNLDGTFRPIAQTQGIAGDGRASRQVLVCDLDNDHDTDIIVINDQPPNDVYINDRLWSYRHADSTLGGLDVTAAVAGDLDADGRVEVYARLDDRSVVCWRPETDATERVTAFKELSNDGDRLAVVDLDGGGVLELRGIGHWTSVVLDATRGPALVGGPAGDPPQVRHPGAGRYRFVGLVLSGKEDAGQSMRSNASGIGALVAARVGSRWTIFDTFRNTSGPGQSLEPVAIGLGDANRIDFISIDWPDGVLQTEIDLAAGEVHRINQTQRQTSSCPVLFAYNGQDFKFVSDVLGVGGVGFMVAPGEYAPSRPWENFLLPDGLLAPLDGRYVLKIGEPMQEACYLDAAELVAYDLPPGWSMVLDERMGILGPDPTGEPRFYREALLPARAFTNRGVDVTATLARADLLASPVGALDHRFIGRLREPYTVTVVFDESLTGRAGTPILVADGWIEYPYSQTMFAAWQAGATYDAPTLQARGADGTWHTVLEQFGYPAGMPRRMSVDLPDLPPGTDRLRLTTNQEIYWDRIEVAFAEPLPETRQHQLAMVAADVRRSGFALRTTGAQRQPYYDYGQRTPFWDTRHQAGMYTEFGPAKDLVMNADGAMAIIGPGEETHLEFDATTLPPIRSGWTRRFVLETRGWCKDMDLYTRNGTTIDPLPGERDGAAQALHDRYNTRFDAGR